MNNFGIYNVKDFGARGNGEILDTESIQSAIDECNKQGGGTVFFPADNSYLIGTIYLKSNVTLQICANAEILGSTRMSDYTQDTGTSPYYPEPLDICLIYAEEAENIGLSGKGTIDGQQRGKTSNERNKKIKELQQIPGSEGREARQRPMLIRFDRCRNICISELTLKGSWSWCTHIRLSENIKLDKVNLFNDRQDGFNIESSTDITISNCKLECGDDGIALTTSDKEKALRNLTVSNCLISSRWAAVRLGPLSKGNFENITISNCVFHQCGGGGIKIGMFEGAEVRNCLFSNIVMEEVTAPVSMFVGTWTDIGSRKSDPPLMPVGKIKDVQFQNISAYAAEGPVKPWHDSEIPEEKRQDVLRRPDRNSTVFIHGHPESEIENISFNNVNLRFPGGGTLEQAERRDIIDINEIDLKEGGYWTEDKNLWGIMPAFGIYVRHLNGFYLNGIRFNLETPDKRPAVFCSDSKDLDFSQLKVPNSSRKNDLICVRCL